MDGLSSGFRFSDWSHVSLFSFPFTVLEKHSSLTSSATRSFIDIERLILSENTTGTPLKIATNESKGLNILSNFSAVTICPIVRTIGILLDRAPSIICLQIALYQSKDEYELTTKTTCSASFAWQMKHLLPKEKTNLRWEILWACHLFNCLPSFYPSPLPPWYWLSWLATMLLDSSLKALTQKIEQSLCILIFEFREMVL